MCVTESRATDDTCAFGLINCDWSGVFAGGGCFWGGVCRIYYMIGSAAFGLDHISLYGNGL